MLKLILNRLRISNFKGIKSADFNFSETVTSITGHNGTGKSTVADALAWLIRGKNVTGDTDQRFTIKTVDANGDTIPDLDHEVEGFFTRVDTETGETEEIRIRRAFVEEWKTEAGTVGKTLKGHHTDYFWNDIPVKKSEYETRIAEIIPPEVFRVITDPYAFLQLPWDEQRAQLTAITGEVKPEDVAAGVQKFNDLLKNMSGATIEEYKTKLGADRKRVIAELEKIPIRIDELSRATPEAPDFAALETRKKEIEAELEKIIAAANDIAAANRLQFEAAAKIQNEINEQERIKFDAVREAKMAASEQLYKIKEQHQSAEADIRLIDNQIKDLSRHQTTIDGYLADAVRFEREAQERDTDLKALRSQFEMIAAQEYTPGSLVCPRFGHICADPTACSKGEDAYNEAQVKTLMEMREKGHKLGEEVKRLKTATAGFKAKHDTALTELTAKRKGLEAELTAALTRRDLLPAIPAEPVVIPEQLPRWREASLKIADLEAELAATRSGQANTPTGDPDARRKLNMELDDVNRKLSLRSIIEGNKARQAELEAQTVTLAQEKADLELLIREVEEFNLAIINAVEERVNKHFDLVRFRMFKTLVNGKREPDCIATVNGVNYRDANTASKINAGLDIIQALTRYYQIQAPIFVDNCESVADVKRPEGAQLIRLEYVFNQPLTVTPQ